MQQRFAQTLQRDSFELGCLIQQGDETVEWEEGRPPVERRPVPHQAHAALEVAGTRDLDL